MASQKKVVPLTLSQALQRALLLQNKGQLGAAIRIYKSILKTLPDEFDTLHLLGLAFAQQGKYKQAERHLRAAVKVDPKSSEALTNLANTLQALGKRDESIALYKEAIAIDPESAATHYNLGMAYAALDQHELAVVSLHASAEKNPADAKTQLNLGLSLHALDRVPEAIIAFQRALDIDPKLVEAYNNLGNALRSARQHDDASAAFERALELRPDFAEAHNNVGLLHADQGRWDDAVESYKTAVALKPGFLAAHANLVAVLAQLERHDEVIRQSETLTDEVAESPALLAALLRAKRQSCNWDGILSIEQRVDNLARTKGAAIDPFLMLSVSDDPYLHLSLSRRRSAKFECRLPFKPAGKRRSERIRIAYLSPDFRMHATSHLMCGLLERHDRDRFEVFGISFGPSDNSEIRKRVVTAFDRFIDVRSASDQDATKQIRELDTDIAIDLAGHTRFSRPGILARRPARVQALYLGYPGSMGAPFIDYALVDKYTVPHGSEDTFDEHLAHVPGCYFATSYDERAIPAAPSRKDCGLPEDGFVFCGFGGSYKITPDVFDIWMRLLISTPKSVLWLLGGAPDIEKNLRREAASRKVDPQRIVFAKRRPLGEHLARHCHADVLLDTFPCGAHTTASDALWMGVPVITRSGRSFASRVAASMLHECGLADLVTENVEDYEALARRLAVQPENLRSMKAKLRGMRESVPLFNSRQRVGQLEAIYETMMDNWAASREARPIM